MSLQRSTFFLFLLTVTWHCGTARACEFHRKQAERKRQVTKLKSMCNLVQQVRGIPPCADAIVERAEAEAESAYAGYQYVSKKVSYALSQMKVDARLIEEIKRDLPVAKSGARGARRGSNRANVYATVAKIRAEALIVRLENTTELYHPQNCTEAEGDEEEHCNEKALIYQEECTKSVENVTPESLNEALDAYKEVEEDARIRAQWDAMLSWTWKALVKLELSMARAERGSNVTHQVEVRQRAVRLVAGSSSHYQQANWAKFALSAAFALAPHQSSLS
ncbi:hypothetical protein TRVL_08669 [Trypanosoma vivax]|nr:hypothetical protein TRVL_08669 [Trypanosoma vivax]